MRLLLVVFLMFPSFLWADPRAVVRIHSHGASGEVIGTAKGKSWVLSCWHMFQDPGSMSRKLRIDGVLQAGAPAVKAQARVLAVDRSADLSLIEISNGPFYSIKVAPPNSRISGRAYSLGYDEMKWPITNRVANITSVGSKIFTREIPWHGRSGGALIDSQTGYLVGVVQGYETRGSRRGVYVSHQDVVRFLRKHAPFLIGETARRSPRPRPQPQPRYAAPIQQQCPT